MTGNVPILLVENDIVDHILVKQAFTDLGITRPLEIRTDGEAALSYLRDAKNVKPAVIFLDLDMPRMNGLEFLKTMKEDENLKIIPVVMLTTSREEQDKAACFRLGVAGYMVKPLEYARFVEVIETMNRYWTFSELPT
jgi:CheY-like chemotaxis protein